MFTFLSLFSGTEKGYALKPGVSVTNPLYVMSKLNCTGAMSGGIDSCARSSFTSAMIDCQDSFPAQVLCTRNSGKFSYFFTLNWYELFFKAPPFSKVLVPRWLLTLFRLYICSSTYARHTLQLALLSCHVLENSIYLLTACDSYWEFPFYRGLLS